MLSKFFSAILLSGVLLLPSCKEEPPFIDLTPKDKSLKDTTYMESTVPAVQSKNALIEDFTGVRCKNCPDAQAAAAQIEAGHPEGRVIIVGLHPNVSFDNFTFPYNMNMDFRSADAEAIMNMLVPPPALPYGVVNRKLYSGESARMIVYQKWESKVSAELLLTSPVNVEVLEKQKTGDSLLVTVKLIYTEAVSEQHFISLGLIESHMIGPQEMPDLSVNQTYEHNHVLRSMGTLAGGEQIAKVNGSSTYEKGRVYIKQFRVKLNPTWQIGNSDIVVTISKASPDLDVVQAVKSPAQ